jgi:hypothetical protein
MSQKKGRENLAGEDDVEILVAGYQIYVFVLSSNGKTTRDGGLAVGDPLFSAASVGTILSFDHDPISDALVVGTGADRVLYTVEQTSERTGSDNDGATDGDGFDEAHIKKYELGESTGLFTGEGKVVIPSSMLKCPFRIEMDSNGYLYVVQQAYSALALAENIYGLSKWDISGKNPVEAWHIGLNDAPDHGESTPNLTNTRATNFNGLAIDEARGRVYVSRKNCPRLVHNVLVYDIEKGDFITSFSAAQSVVGGSVEDLPNGGGSSIRDVNVDAAGNVMIVNSSFEALRIFSPPEGPNSFNTFSPWAIDVDNSQVIETPDIFSAVEPGYSNIPVQFTIKQNYAKHGFAKKVVCSSDKTTGRG